MMCKTGTDPLAGIKCRTRLGCLWLVITASLLTCPSAFSQTASDTPRGPAITSAGQTLPDAPSANSSQSSSFGSRLGAAGKTIGQDEWHLIKAPFHKKNLVWDGLFLAATGVLIANDESVLYQVPVGWHPTSLNISDAGVYGISAVAGGIYLTGLFTKNEHSQEVGIRTAEATVDSVILYGAMKAIFQRQRPYSGPGEGKFFSGNWTNGSFPSGHSMFAWTIASSVAHQYHSIPLDLALYGIASTVTVTRVTAGQHFPSDVFVGSVLGYLVGDYVAHKSEKVGPIRASKLQSFRSAVLNHIDIGVE